MLKGLIFRGIITMMAGRIFGNLIGLVTTIAAAYLLTPTDLGIHALAFSVVILISAFLEFQTSLILINIPNPSKSDFDTVFTINLLRGGFVAAIVASNAWLLAGWFSTPDLQLLLLVFAIYPLLLGLRNPYFELHAKQVQFTPGTFMELGAKLATFVVTISIALTFASYWALVGGLLASAVVQSLVTYIYSPKLPGFSLKSFRRIFSFSVWLAFAAIIEQIKQQAPRLIIGGGLGTGVLGVYALGGQVVTQILTSVLNPVNAAVYSGFGKMQSEPERLRKSYRMAQGGHVSLLVPMAVGLALVAPELIDVIFEDEWRQAAIFIQFAAAGWAFNLLPGPSWALSMALGTTKRLFWRSLWSALVSVSLQVLGFWLHALAGLLWFGLVAQIINALILHFFVKSLTKLRIMEQLANVARPLTSLCVLVFAVHACDFVLGQSFPVLIQLAAKTSFGAISYLAATYLVWLLAGRPEGHESMAMEFICRLLVRLRSSLVN